MEKQNMRDLLHHKIHFLSADADWLVFIHGAGGSIVTWKYQIEAFKPYFNLLLPDLRDHGQSKNIEPAARQYDFDIVADDVLYLLDHLGIRRAHFMSLSLGSVILQKLTQKRRQLVDRMVMAGGVFRATFVIKFFVHSAKYLSYILPYQAIYYIFSWVVMPRKNHKFSRQIFRRQSKKLSPEEYLKWVGLYKDFFRLLKAFFHQPLRNLCLVAMGEQDHVFLEAARRFAANQEHARFVLFEHCGHICNIEQPQKFNKVALSFLSQSSVDQAYALQLPSRL